MTTKECENRNNIVLKNLIYHGSLDSVEELFIAAGLLDVNIPYRVYETFIEMDNWSPRCTGAFKMNLTAVERLHKKAMTLKKVLEEQEIEIL